MLKVESTEVFGWEAAIRGMRNPMNSWDKSDSELKTHYFTDDGNYYDEVFVVGENDLKLMKNLSKAGSDHGKFLRMINVTFDLTAPLYFLKEFDTYKVATVSNSCSTMHKIQAKEFELDDFSHEHLIPDAVIILEDVIDALNDCRDAYVNYDVYKDRKDFMRGVEKKDIWWNMIQLLPSSYNQKRTVQLNYQVLKSMYFARRQHKLDCWRTLCDWMLTLPYFKEVCVDVVDNS